jgi:hypothetical protein
LWSPSTGNAESGLQVLLTLLFDVICHHLQMEFALIAAGRCLSGTFAIRAEASSAAFLIRSLLSGAKLRLTRRLGAQFWGHHLSETSWKRGSNRRACPGLASPVAAENGYLLVFKGAFRESDLSAGVARHIRVKHRLPIGVFESFHKAVHHWFTRFYEFEHYTKRSARSAAPENQFSDHCLIGA